METAPNNTQPITPQPIVQQSPAPQQANTPPVSKKSKKVLFISLIIAGVALLVGLSFWFLGSMTKKETASLNKPLTGEYLTILWADWAPANFLETLSKEYTKETGVEIRIIKEPWSNFQNVFFAEMDKKGDTYDLVVGDSQWLGRGAVAGNYVDLTKWIKEKKVDQSMIPAAITGYSEYPKGSGKYWAIPLEGDAMGIAYRKDLFEDPKEMAAFKAKYGYDLGVPKTWDELKDIAEFFHRPAANLHGISIWTEKSYDGSTMQFESLLWAYGGDLGDYKTYKIKGILNSKESIEALTYYKELYKYTPPNWNNAFFSESNQAFSEGKVAMAINFFAFFPDLTDKTKNPYAEQTAFFSYPSGPKGKYSSLGGQGLSLISYSKKQDLAFNFMEWFIQQDTQEKWAELGGYSSNENVLNSKTFLSATPYNRAFMESMNIIKDFWSVPEYDKLLPISQKYINQAVTTNEITPEDALNSIASEWENVFEDAGYYKE